MEAPRVFAYLDYRQYLKDWFFWKKQARASFSLRLFTQKLGLTGTSFLSAVLKGKKNLSDEVRHKVAAALGLSGDEEAFFHLLVQFNQAREMQVKNFYFRQMERYRGSRAQKVGEGQYRFYSRWYYAAVWNYLAIHPREQDAARIACRLQPELTAAEVEEAIAVLLELGMLRKTTPGYAVERKHWTTEPEVASLAVKNHILELNRIAAEQLEKIPADLRLYNTLMFQVSEEGYKIIRERIRQFQEELRGILDHDKNEDRIYTLSMSLFPNSRIES